MGCGWWSSQSPSCLRGSPERTQLSLHQQRLQLECRESTSGLGGPRMGSSSRAAGGIAQQVGSVSGIAGVPQCPVGMPKANEEAQFPKKGQKDAGQPRSVGNPMQSATASSLPKTEVPPPLTPTRFPSGLAASTGRRGISAHPWRRIAESCTRPAPPAPRHLHPLPPALHGGRGSPRSRDKRPRGQPREPGLRLMPGLSERRRRVLEEGFRGYSQLWG